MLVQLHIDIGRLVYFAWDSLLWTCDELLTHLQLSIWGSSNRVLWVVTPLPKFGMEALGFTTPLLSFGKQVKNPQVDS